MKMMLKARIAGGLWLIVIVASALAFGPTAKLIEPDDAAATAGNVLANENTVRLGVAAELVAGIAYMGVTVLLYVLLKPVSRSLSLLSVVFGAAGFAFGGPGLLARLAPLLLLGGAPYLDAFTPEQLQALALTSFKLHALGFNISLGAFFGPQCLILGYLIVRSTFLPKILGVLLAIGGAGYVLGSFTKLLSPSPPYGAVLGPAVAVAAILGEGALGIWLLVRGVNVTRREEQAG